MQLGQALQQGWERLEAEAVPSARLAAEVLLMHALGCDRARLYAHPEQELGEQELQRYAAYVRERAGGKPTQYITGRQEFWGLEFRVTPDALIPRPETEHVVERAAELCRGGAPIIIDVGTGSGCIAIALAHEVPRARVLGADISEGALRVAAENARRLAPHLRLCRCDLLAAIADGVADLVVCNPPYVPHSAAAGLQREIRDFEPPEAVFAGPEGMEFYARLLPEAARVLRPGGWVVLELGYNTADRVRALLGGCWDQVEVRPDLAGIPRALSAKRIMS